MGRPIGELLSAPEQAVLDPSREEDKQGRPRGGSPLALARRRMGYTQESFAEAVGVEFSTVGCWERGQNRPHVWMRSKIARALKMPTEELTEMLEPSIPDSDDGKQKSKVSVYWSNAIFADSGVTEVGGDRDMPVNRRSFLSIAAVAAVDMGVADEFTASIAGGDAEPLVHVQTTYEMDLAVASVVDRGTKNTLMRWTDRRGSPVARVNGAGILAKIPDQRWGEAAQFIEKPVDFPLAPIAVERFMREVINPRDRWSAMVRR
jgi:DNA-binding XRE family transcriptional regulator